MYSFKIDGLEMLLHTEAKPSESMESEWSVPQPSSNELKAYIKAIGSKYGLDSEEYAEISAVLEFMYYTLVEGSEGRADNEPIEGVTGITWELV